MNPAPRFREAGFFAFVAEDLEADGEGTGVAVAGTSGSDNRDVTILESGYQAAGRSASSSQRSR
jgi:hypothetical protein